MYTLLTVWGVAAGYCLVQVMPVQRNLVFDKNQVSEMTPWRSWLAYIALATAALYTHYFAFFLLVGLGCAILLDQISHAGHAPETTSALSNPMRNYLFANLAVLILYTPWLGVLWNRALVDASYWQGQFKIGEGVRNIALSFVAGETAPATYSVWLLLFAGLVTLAALFALWRGCTQKRTGVFQFRGARPGNVPGTCGRPRGDAPTVPGTLPNAHEAHEPVIGFFPILACCSGGRRSAVGFLCT
jgi:hypothetical protein